MRKKCCFCFIALSLVSNVTGKDDVSQLSGVKRLLSYSFIESVSVTSTNMIIRTTSSEDIAHRWEIEPNAEIILTPNKETVFVTALGGSVTVSPVSFWDKRKGFRVKNNNPSPVMYNERRIIHTDYIALSDTPMEVGEDDVEMVMDKGKWVTARDWRKNMELDEKYGWPASHLVQYAEKIMREAKEGELLVHEPTISNIWNKLVEDGIIKTNTVEKEGKAVSPSQKKKGRIAASLPSREGNDEEQRGETSSPYRLWLYVGVSLCALCAILYFLRRKLKT